MTTTTAADFLPADRDIDSLRSAAASCQGCGLYRHATQTVFGDGPDNPKLIVAGEQPGDKEDTAGEPFVGPAGSLLGRALTEAGIDRREAYVTNAVKHFKFVPPARRARHHAPGVGAARSRRGPQARLRRFGRRPAHRRPGADGLTS